METIIGALPQLADLIQKAGVIGVLLIVAGVLVYEVRRLRMELGKVYANRDRLALAVVKLKTTCDAHDIRVDLNDLKDLIPNGEMA